MFTLISAAFFSAFFSAAFLGSVLAQAQKRSSDVMVQVQVNTVVLDSKSKQPVVLLEDTENGRFLPIWIGHSEARAISMQLERIMPPRPMTHDLLRNVIKGLQAKVARIVVTELRSGTFFARIEMQTAERKFSIDSRPSDAIALALRTKSPIFVKANVLRDDVAGISIPRLTHRHRLGIVLQSMNPSLARFFGGGNGEGVLVSEVSQGSPGEKAGLRRGDIILELEGRTTSDVRMFERMYPKYPGGFKVTVKRGQNDSKFLLRLVPLERGSTQTKR